MTEFLSDLLKSEELRNFVAYAIAGFLTYYGLPWLNELKAWYQKKRDLIAVELYERTNANVATQVLQIVAAVERYGEKYLEGKGEEKLALAFAWAKEKGLNITQADIEAALTHYKEILNQQKMRVG